MTKIEAGCAMGADPGVGGGWAVFNIMDASWPIATGVTPTFPSARGSGREYNVPTMVLTLRTYMPKRLYVEDVRFYPVGKQQVLNAKTGSLEWRPRWPAPSGIVKLAAGLHYWEGIAAALGIGVVRVPPKEWQAAMLGGQPKQKTREAAIAVASRLFPREVLVPGHCKLPHDGICVACLLGEMGRRQLCGQLTDAGGIREEAKAV